MEDKSKTLERALLSWARLKHNLSTYSKDNLSQESDLEKLEEFIYNHKIQDLAIINKSPDYYTLKYLIEGQTKIKQFLTSDIESHI